MQIELVVYNDSSETRSLFHTKIFACSFCRTDNISKSVSELEERMEANFVKLSRKTRNVKV